MGHHDLYPIVRTLFKYPCYDFILLPLLLLAHCKVTGWMEVRPLSLKHMAGWVVL